MFSYSQVDMWKMIKVRNLLSLFERTPPARVVNGLCDRDTYFCSPRFVAILNRSPCSPWEQHHVVSSVAQAPAWTLPERVVIRPYGSGNCGCRRNPPGRVVSCPWISDFCGRRSSALPRRTPPERVVVSLCVNGNGASRAILESVDHVVSSATTITPYSGGNCGCRRNPPGRAVSCPWISDFCGRRSSAMLRRTPAGRVVVSLCMYENGASRAILESVNHVVSSVTTITPYGSGSSGRCWTAPERVTMGPARKGCDDGSGLKEPLINGLEKDRTYVRGICSSIYSFAKQCFAEQKCEAQWTAHAGFGMSTCGSSVSYDANSVHLHAASCAGANHPYAHAMHYIPSSSVSSLSSSASELSTSWWVVSE